MHEPLLERIRVLELAVQRWRLVSLALALMLVSLVAIGGTFGVVLMLHEDFFLSDRRQQELEMMRADAERAHEQAVLAQREADAARQQMFKNGGPDVKDDPVIQPPP